MATMMWMFLWLGGCNFGMGDPLGLSCSFEVDLCGWSSSGSDLWLRQNGSSTSDPEGTGPDGAEEGVFYIVAKASGSNTSIKSYSLSSPSFSSAADWQFSFAYYMFGSNMGELVLQGWSQDSWATIWQISGDHGAAWHKVDVNIPLLASQLIFVSNTSVGDIALDAFEIGFIVLSGPCTSTTGCIQSPNYPNDYSNSQLCEIAAPAKPLYSTHFATEGGYDILTVDGVAYSASSGPPQGTITSEIIHWSSDGSIASGRWQICIASGLFPADPDSPQLSQVH